MAMNILVVGGGGREHAIVWKLQQSPLAGTIFAAPGNPGMRHVIRVPMGTPAQLAEFAGANNVGLTMVGPEAPLCDGIVDEFRRRGLRIVGPTQAAAQLEGSKAFAKRFMVAHGIPTAASATFTDAESAVAYIRQQGAPIVVKADGLAAGKGVIVAMTEQEAVDGVRMCFSGAFGAAGATVVVEEFLEGEEASILAFTDGETIVPLASSQDHKRIGDGDTGPNTGGMGAYSPAPVVTDAVWKLVREQVLDRFLAGCRKEGLDYRGVIYAGVMVTNKGIGVLEFNVRFGDPETQAVLMRLDSDLVEALVAVADKKLAGVELKWGADPAVCVVMAAKGYPGTIEKGAVISGFDAAEATGAVVFHAGTAQDAQGRFTVQGGRVLGVTARGATVADAVARAYRAVDAIHWDGAYCRRDIAGRALKRG